MDAAGRRGDHAWVGALLDRRLAVIAAFVILGGQACDSSTPTGPGVSFATLTPNGPPTTGRPNGGGAVSSASPSATPRPSPTPYNRVAPGVTPTGGGSTNWSGYITAAHGRTFSHVQATWRQPTVRCPSTGHAAVSIWIGMSDTTGERKIEQIGTTAACRDGRVDYYAWYELVPKQRASVPIRLGLKAGDLITVSVDRSGNRYTLRIKAGSAHARLARTYAGEARAVEWIVEAPCSPTSSGCPVDPLAKFDTITMRMTLARSAGHTGSIDDPSWTTERITMRTRSGVTKARPGSLQVDGSRFSVVWRHR